MNFKLKTGVGVLCAVLTVSTIFTGCSKIDTKATLVTVDDGADTVSLGYYNFVAKYQQAIYDMSYRNMMGDTMWTQDLGGSAGTMEDSVKKNVLDNVEAAYLSKKHAADYKIEISEDESKKIDEAVKSFFDENEDSAIKELGATEEYVKTFLEYQYYNDKVYNAVKEETNVSVTDDEAAQSTISYVLYSTEAKYDQETGESVELTDEEKAAEKAKAETLLTAEDFDAQAEASDVEVETFSYDKNASSYDGLTVPSEVITAAKKLKDGERSEIIETDKGYYIARMDKKDDADASATRKSELEEEQKQAHYDEVLEGWKSEIKWDVDDTQLAKIKYETEFSQAAEPADEEAEEPAEE